MEAIKGKNRAYHKHGFLFISRQGIGLDIVNRHSMVNITWLVHSLILAIVTNMYARFYAKSRETCQRIGRSKAALLGHCIKSCICNTFRDCEKPSVGADARGNP